MHHTFLIYLLFNKLSINCDRLIVNLSLAEVWIHKYRKYFQNQVGDISVLPPDAGITPTPCLIAFTLVADKVCEFALNATSL